MFTKTQRYYDAIYSWKDYASETARILEIIDGHFPDGAGALLDVACGTGAHLELLRSHIPVEGIDLDPGMVALARQRNPGVPIHTGDMAEFELARQFGVLICMFSSIGYLEGEDRLRLAIANFARHLRSGGLLLVEPWLDPDSYEARPLPDLFSVELDDIKIARMGHVDRDGDRATIRFDYLVGSAQGVEHITEEHQTWLFTRAQYEEAFRAAGLSVRHDPDGVDGRGLYIGTSP
jgi:SAM-dependent methyltransferase